MFLFITITGDKAFISNPKLTKAFFNLSLGCCNAASRPPGGDRLHDEGDGGGRERP